MIEIKNLTKIYNVNKENEFQALSDINLIINNNEMVAIMGKSGAGKSTLLHILAGIDRATEGDVIIDNINLSSLKKNQLSEFRNNQVGIIMQDFQLMEYATTLENVILPLYFRKMKNKKRLEAASELIYGVGLENHIKKPVNLMSGGEKQRVAIARALITSPSIILADEPTGSLDSENSQHIIDMLKRINKKGKTVIIITHDKDLANHMDRIIFLKDGKVIDEPN
ncbi:MAG: ABC transporter ATP-binding protein [Bacilli bacterium]|nr:ABC transporter ATP-binding protein [Bacilli bacterium]